MKRIITLTGSTLAVLLIAGVAWAGFASEDNGTTTTTAPSNGPTTTSTTAGGADQTDDDLGGNDDADEIRFVCDPTDGFDQELATIQLPAGQEFEIEVEDEHGQTVCKVDFKDADDNAKVDDDLGGNDDADEIRFVCDPTDGFDQELATIQLPAGQEFEIEVEDEHGQTICKVEFGDDDDRGHDGGQVDDNGQVDDDNSGHGGGEDDNGQDSDDNSGHGGGSDSDESSDD